MLGPDRARAVAAKKPGPPGKFFFAAILGSEGYRPDRVIAAEPEIPLVEMAHHEIEERTVSLVAAPAPRSGDRIVMLAEELVRRLAEQRLAIGRVGAGSG